MMKGFSPASSSPPRIFWNSRKRSAAVRSSEESLKTPIDRPPKQTSKMEEEEEEEDDDPAAAAADERRAEPDVDPRAGLSARRRALFEPLESGDGGRRTPNELLLPPPDFDATSYPRGWLVGKKRKLVNVDVVESMRKIAIQEMNRKDREIDGLNVQLEEDSRCLEHLQVQLLEERSKRVDAERQNAMFQDQISMLMNMLEETQAAEEQEEEEEIVADQN